MSEFNRVQRGVFINKTRNTNAPLKNTIRKLNSENKALRQRIEGIEEKLDALVNLQDIEYGVRPNRAH